MGTTTLTNLDVDLLQAIGDYRNITVTTAIAASTSLVSTTLQQYRNTADYFNGFWAYIADYANIGVSRYISDDDGTSTLTVLGGNLSTDGANLATFTLSRFSWADRVLAINQALQDIYPSIYVPVDNMNLVTGNILPDPSLEDWFSSSAMTWYSASNATLTRTNTAGYIRGIKGSYSAKVAASAGNGYLYISSNSYPRLLDLMGQTVTFRAWAYPEVANDAYVEIYTIKADGTTQTLTSTSTCPAGKWSLLELEDQAINDDIVEIQFRFKVATNAKYAYFDSASAIGSQLVADYVLPLEFAYGEVSQVLMQSSAISTSDFSADDISVVSWTPLQNADITSDGTNSYLLLPAGLPQERRLRLIGKKAFGALSSATDTIGIDDERSLRLLATYAAHKLYSNARNTASGSDLDKMAAYANDYLLQYYRMGNNKMVQKPVRLNTPRY